MTMRLPASVGVALIASSAFAQWTATDITPASFPRSISGGSSANRWCGEGFPAAGSGHAFVVTGSTAQDLTTGGYSFGRAFACTDALTVGTGEGAATNGYVQPVMWKADGTAVNLTSPGYIEGNANGVWGPYVVGGLSNNGSTQQLNAIVWYSSPNLFTLLPNSGKSSCANAIQQLNVVGYIDPTSLDGSTAHAAFWSGFTATPVDLNPSLGGDSSANAIDGLTQAGIANNQPALWHGSAASYVNLEPAGSATGSVYGVLGNTEVGFVGDGQGSGHAALWNGTAASFVNLDQFLPANLGHGVAQSISIQGAAVVIYGYASDTNTGDVHSVQWTRPLYTAQILPGQANSSGRANGVSGKYVFGYLGTNGVSQGTVWDISNGNFSTDGILSDIKSMYGSLRAGQAFNGISGAFETDHFSFQRGSNLFKVTSDGNGGFMEIGVGFGLSPGVWFGTSATNTVLPTGSFRSPQSNGGYNGAIVGSGVDSSSVTHALYWANASTVPVDLGSQAHAFCAGPGVQAGQSGGQAAMWSGAASSLVLLGPANSQVIDMYYEFQVGQSPTGAMVWEGSAASGVNLDQFLPTGYTGVATGAGAYNGNLVISGYAKSGNTTKAVIWTRDAP